MFDKAIKYSYAAQKRERYKLIKAILAILTMFLLFTVVSTYFYSAWVLHNETMQPTLHSGDRFIIVSSALPSLFAKMKQSDGASQFRRGNLVLLDTSRKENRSMFLTAADNFVRFFSAQKLSIFPASEHLYLKRLAGLPGDEITMINFTLRVRPEGELYALTEFELAERPYYPNIPQIPAIWDGSLPFSGTMERRILGPDEYFIISDDRGSTGDSRTWGPVSAKEIIGKPVFRYWPFTRIGRP